MPPELVTPDGKPVGDADELRAEINQDFSRAMAAEDPGESQAPPKRERFTTDAKGETEAPRRRRGRPSKDEKPRTTSTPPVNQKSDKDYTEALAGLTTSAWAVAASIPYTCPYAAVIDANQTQLVTALNSAAQNNAKAREAIEKFTSGGGGLWAVQLAAVGTNMTMQTLQIMKSPEIRAEAAAATQAKFRAFLRAQGVSVPDEPAPEAPHAPAAA